MDFQAGDHLELGKDQARRELKKKDIERLIAG